MAAASKCLGQSCLDAVAGGAGEGTESSWFVVPGGDVKRAASAQLTLLIRMVRMLEQLLSSPFPPLFL